MAGIRGDEAEHRTLTNSGLLFEHVGRYKDKLQFVMMRSRPVNIKMRGCLRSKLQVAARRVLDESTW